MCVSTAKLPRSLTAVCIVHQLVSSALSRPRPLSTLPSAPHPTPRPLRVPRASALPTRPIPADGVQAKASITPLTAFKFVFVCAANNL